MTLETALVQCVCCSAGVFAAAPAVSDLPAGIAAFEAGDVETALDLLAPEAEAGDAQAQYLMGELLSGGAVPRDLMAATQWYRKAAEGGVSEAQFQLGMRCSVGLGLEQDLVQAYRWLTIAGQSLNTEAVGQFVQTFIGKMSAEDVAEAEDLVAAWQGSGNSVAVAPASGGLKSAARPPEEAELSVDEALQAALELHPCSDVRLEELAQGRWRLAGLVENDAATDALVAALEAAVAAEKLERDLTAVGRPVCAAAVVAGRFRDPFRMAMTVAEGKAEFADGETVVVDLTLPAVSGYLYVDYFQLDGQVVHILPLADVASEKTQAGGQLRLGDGSAGLTLRVGPPFGKEMLTAFVTAEPIFAQPRELVEEAEAYLLALAQRLQALDGGGKGQTVSDALLITTVGGQ